MPHSRREFLAFPFAFPIAFDSRGRVTRSETRSAEGFSDALPHGAPPLEMVQLPGGTMNDERGRQRLVSPFALARFEVTNQQWNAVARLPKRKRALTVRPMGKASAFGWEPEQAVEMAAFDDCLEFCSRVSRLTGRTYRLPTEMEWQFGCRAGTRSRFWWGEQWNAALVAMPQEKAPRAPGSTGFANAYGIYDMVGNVDEWVAPSGKGRDRFHLFHATATESDWLSDKFVRNGLGFRVAV